jgi:predicted acetyltransferase
MSVDSASVYLVRPMQDGDRGLALDAVWRAFGWGPRTLEADVIVSDRAIEVDRTLLALDTRSAQEVVGTTSAYSLRMTAPGGACVPVAGVWMVSVTPTHRRRGVLSAMMRRQLTDLAATGEATAALWTTEAAIYQRYGYGLATWRQRIELDLVRAQFTPRANALAAQSPARLRHMALLDALPHLTAVHQAVLDARPGMLARTEHRWKQLMGGEDGPTPEIVVAVGPDGPTGYAVYRIREGNPALVPAGEVSVQEVSAQDPATHAQLWRYLLDLDLMRTLSCDSRPLPDPLAHLLLDHRQMYAKVDDALWVRILDVPRALGERAFAGPVDLVLEVTDDLLPANAGCWRVTVTATGQAALAQRTSDQPDLSMDVSDLGAAHLGATLLHDLAHAGRVVEHTRGALTTASAAWSWSPSAACLEVF